MGLRGPTWRLSSTLVSLAHRGSRVLHSIARKSLILAQSSLNYSWPTVFASRLARTFAVCTAFVIRCTILRFVRPRAFCVFDDGEASVSNVSVCCVSFFSPRNSKMPSRYSVQFRRGQNCPNIPVTSGVSDQNAVGCAVGVLSVP